LLPELRRRALRLTRNASAADDLVQDTVVRALAFSDSFEQGTNLRGWIHQVLFSVFVSGYRKRTRERKALSRLACDPVAWTPSHEPAPDQLRELTAPSRARLEAMPPSYRSVVELVDMGECSYREAAETLELPLGTVMSRLHRGRKLLATMFEPERALAA
ncbi:sigma-70 family RNA polymerase sigma factor, partial [bacterium]